MGYDLRVTRAAPITLDEWVAYVEACDDLRMERGGAAVWMGHPEHEGAGVRFSFPGSHVEVEDPDEPTVERMHELAAALGGRVRGEDGEVYFSNR